MMKDCGFGNISYMKKTGCGSIMVKTEHSGEYFSPLFLYLRRKVFILF